MIAVIYVHCFVNVKALRLNVLRNGVRICVCVCGGSAGRSCAGAGRGSETRGGRGPVGRAGPLGV